MSSFVFVRKNSIALAAYSSASPHERKCPMNMQLHIKPLQGTLHNIFYKFLPLHGFSVRPDQAKLSAHMLASLQSRNTALCEAGVGTGKTHAYIMAAVLHMLDNPHAENIRKAYPCDSNYHKTTQMPIVLSTSSIQLQRAITQEYIPQISRILRQHGIIKKPLTFVVRKGKSHYVCDCRLEDYIKSEAARDDYEKWQILKRLTAAGFTQIDLDELDLRPYIKSRINVPLWCNSYCPRYSECRYNKLQAYQRQPDHTFQVCNHNYFFADLMKRTQEQPSLIPNYQAVVFDEAHKLLDAARQIYGFSLSEHEFSKLCENLQQLVITQCHAARKTILDFCENLQGSVQRLFADIMGIARSDQQEEVDRYPLNMTDIQIRRTKRIVTLLEYLLDYMMKSLNTAENQKSLRLYVMQTVNVLHQHMTALTMPKELVLWLEMPKQETGSIFINAIPKRLDKLLYNDFWRKRIPTILTSGTISATGSFRHFKKNLGLHRALPNAVTEMSHVSPFDYQNHCLLHIAADLPFPDPKDTNYLDAIAMRIQRLVKATHGHTLVLFTSYKVMELVYLRLKAKINYPFLIVGRGALNTIEQFRDSKNGILFATGSFWEGVDLPGDILSSLIVVKLPFPTPDPISEYERTLYPDDAAYIQNALIPQMLVKLKQGAGRLIRNETDTGVISILDSRLRKGGKYRADVIRTLPKCGTADNVFDIERFIREKKPVEYFGTGA